MVNYFVVLSKRSNGEFFGGSESRPFASTNGPTINGECGRPAKNNNVAIGQERENRDLRAAKYGQLLAVPYFI